ncbi:hypothetical protein TNCT_521831 [Trichonephila clavata]|uniref:Uncharacterized protein n=1 Tax=Trichonephila clavata TaxID=2740835 RepID=A0A8X6IHJ4_TRICU|nr:hypothetical protein TNCT_521831 [Trichonephila clavata]
MESLLSSSLHFCTPYKRGVKFMNHFYAGPLKPNSDSLEDCIPLYGVLQISFSEKTQTCPEDKIFSQVEEWELLSGPCRSEDDIFFSPALLAV